MADVAALGFAVDSSQLVSGAKALDQLAASGKGAEAAAARLTKAQATVGASSQRLSNEQKLVTAVSRQSIIAQSELGDKVELLSRNTEQAYRSLSTRSFFRLMAREASMAGGPLASVIGHVGILGVGGQRLGVALVGSTIGFAAVVAAAYKAVSAYLAFNEQQIKVQSMLNLTKGASGQTTDSLEKLAQQFSANGTQSVQDIRAIELELLKFKAVGGDSFGAVIQIAKDVAATGFADLKTAAVALGKALKDPSKASEELADIGLKLSVSEQRLATDLYNSGRAAQARALIMKTVSAQAAGADTLAADTLGASWTRMANTTLTVLERWGKLIAEGIRLKDVMNGIADAADRSTKRSTNPLADVDDRISIARGTISSFEGRGGSLAAQGRKRAEAELNRALEERAAILRTVAEAEKKVADAASSATVQQNNADLAEKKKRLDLVNDALDVEARNAGKSAIQQRAYTLAVQAGVEGDKAAKLAIEDKIRVITSADALREITDQIKQQTASLQIETETLGMAIGPATAYRVVQEALVRERIKNNALSPEAIALIEKEGRALAHAATEAQKFRQLKEFIRDTTDLNKQLDSLAVSGINSVASGLTDIAMGTKSVKEGFRDMSLAVIRMIEEMIIKMMIARAIQAALGLGTTGGFGTVSGSEWVDAGKGIGPLAAHHAGGIVGQVAGTRYIHPAYFDDAPRFARGGIVGGEVPIIAHKGEGVFTPEQMKAMGGTNIIFNMPIDARGADPGSVTRFKIAMQTMKEQIKKEVVPLVQKHRGNHPNSLNGQAG